MNEEYRMLPCGAGRLVLPQTGEDRKRPPYWSVFLPARGPPILKPYYERPACEKLGAHKSCETLRSRNEHTGDAQCGDRIVRRSLGSASISVLGLGDQGPHFDVSRRSRWYASSSPG